MFAEVSRAEIERPPFRSSKCSPSLTLLLSYVRKMTSLLEVMITFGLLCEMLELMKNKTCLFVG